MSDSRVYLFDSTLREGTRAQGVDFGGDAHGARRATVGVSSNVIDASYDAPHDGIAYKLPRDGASA